MEPVIIDAVRTPIGKYGGALSSVRPDDLAALVLKALVERNHVPPELIDDVIMGCGNQAGEDNRNVARMAVLLAGLPPSVPGVTVNRLCSSGLDAVNIASWRIRAGEAQLIIAGGVESMSRAPFVLAKPEVPFQRELRVHDTTLGWRFVNPKLLQRYRPLSMGETAEVLAERYGITRREQDEYALESHRRAARATRSGRFMKEILPVPVDGGFVKEDEGIRYDTSLEKLAKLRPAFKEGGTVTAGNSSQISDGAAALLIASREMADRLGLRPMARIVASGIAGVHPDLMGLGPIPATRQALERAKLGLEHMELIELNEAFAAQVLACLREMPMDMNKLNPNGGAIALGHPIGCSGARILTTLLYEMRERRAALGLAALCVGVGQGEAIIVEREG
ncbi:MAG: acetyl-CoA C-acyltransferase [Nitrososphaerota archaeon]|mgnify:CR=1 FL=1